MFDKQYRFYGKHAKMVNELTGVFDEKSKSRMFERNLDVYINAPLVGFLYKTKSKKDTIDNGISPQSIFTEQMINASDVLQDELRTILLLDCEYEPVKEKRLDRAFRHLGKDECDLELFDSYVLGGVEVLYQKLIEEASSTSEYMNKLYDFLEEVQDRYNSEITSETILELCKAK